MHDDERFIRQAIALAAHARQHSEFPVGALLVAGGVVMHAVRDQRNATCDPTQHAELAVISEHCRAAQRLSLAGYTLYSSAEPCVMCAGAIKWARIARVVWSVSQATLQTLSGGRPKPSCASIVHTGGRMIEVVGPLLEDEGVRVFDRFQFNRLSD